MKFIEFKNKFSSNPILYSRDLVRQASHPQAMRNQIKRWQDRGLLLKLRKGIYAFADPAHRHDYYLEWVANRLYEPSYLSLEYALYFYGFIPELVTEWTSITTLKTARFENRLGRFSYRHVQPGVFRGFKKIGEGKLAFFMAEPEKALVDFLYFNLDSFGKSGEGAGDVFKESFRFQNLEDIKNERLLRWAGLFGVKKLDRVAGELGRFVEESR